MVAYELNLHPRYKTSTVRGCWAQFFLHWLREGYISMATSTDYRYYTDSKGHLWSGDEWEKFTDTGDRSGEKLPEGWPKKLEGPLVWSGPELKKQPERYLHTFTEQELKELDNAVKSFEASGLDLPEITRETFPLPRLGPVLDSYAEDLYKGIGVRLLRGIDVDRYSKRERIVIYLGVSSYIGDLRDAQGVNRALIHIKSILHIPKDERAPIAVSQQTTDAQMFHNDIGLDIVSLFVLDTPKEGGDSLITSSYTIYNELAQTRPDLLRLLADPDEFDWRGKPKEGGLIHYLNEKFIAAFSTRVFIGFGDIPRDEAYPALNDKQKDAFGAFHWIGYKNSLILPIQKGDIEYVNNLYLQHSRHGYIEDENHRRHIARLWLRNTKYNKDVKYPPSLQQKIDEGFFPEKYKQEIPLDEFDEEDIKKRYGANTLLSLYAKPV